MEKRYLIWGVIGILFVVALFLTFQAGAMNTGGVTQTTVSATKSAASAASSYGGMVGGC